MDVSCAVLMSMGSLGLYIDIVLRAMGYVIFVPFPFGKRHIIYCQYSHLIFSSKLHLIFHLGPLCVETGARNCFCME